jgi:AraC-like DNA-binding protein
LRESTVSVHFLRDVLRAAAARAVPRPVAVERLAAQAGLPAASLAEPDARVPSATAEAVWRVALDATGDDDFGLHVGEAANPATLGMVGYAMMSSPTLGAALERLSRYLRLLTDGAELHIGPAPDGRHVWLDAPVAEHLENFLLRAPRQVVESSFAWLVAVSRALTGRPLPVREVWFAHPRPRSTVEHERVFAGAAVSFGRPVNRLVVDQDALDWPVPLANPALLVTFEEHARALLAEAEGGEAAGVRERARREVVARLKGEAPTVGDVARALGMGARTLQDALSAEGTTFRDLLDDARRDLAVRHLRDRDTPVAEVALLLGFSEPSAFYRAFKRWTGQTPQAYRLPA